MKLFKTGILLLIIAIIQSCGGSGGDHQMIQVQLLRLVHLQSSMDQQEAIHMGTL